MVRTGEGVFTPEQMRALSPVTSNVNNIVTNVYVDSSGRVSTTTQGTSGLTQSDYREMGRQIAGLVTAILSKEKRSGGQLYVSRSERGG